MAAGVPQSTRSRADAIVTAEDAVLTCATCGRRLSVAERMYYFFEGNGTGANCRVCLALADSERPVHDIESPAIGLATVAEATQSWPFQEAADTQTLVCRAMRAYLQEACDWSARAIGQLDRGTAYARTPSASLDEARRELVRDQLFEAVLAMDAQRRKIARLSRLAERPRRDAPPVADLALDEPRASLEVPATAYIAPARLAAPPAEPPPLLTVQAEARARRPART
jgi:hypothetical protein